MHRLVKWLFLINTQAGEVTVVFSQPSKVALTVTQAGKVTVVEECLRAEESLPVRLGE